MIFYLKVSSFSLYKEKKQVVIQKRGIKGTLLNSYNLHDS